MNILKCVNDNIHAVVSQQMYNAKEWHLTELLNLYNKYQIKGRKNTRRHKSLGKILKLHYSISAVLHTQTSVWCFPSACICLGGRNGRTNGKQLEFRVRKTRQEVDTQKCPCWTGLLLTVLLSECARITGKISMRTAVWFTMPLEKNSLGL